MAPKKSKSKRKKNTALRKKTKRKTQKSSFPLLKYFFVACIWAMIIGTGILFWYGKDLPRLTAQADLAPKTAITFYDRNGQIITRYGSLQGRQIAVFDLKPHTVHAFLATEDRRFYFHGGIDLFGIARAAATNIISGRTVQGGSTITQQLAKNLFLSHERSLKRKIQEIMLALWLEQNFTKDEILSAYLNKVYFGSGAYGIDAAAKIYFGKSATDLNIEESALLAGLLKAPSRYSPHNNPSLARSRTKTVLKAMQDAGYLKGQPDEDLAAFSARPVPFAKPRQDGRTERYFTDWLMDQIPDYVGTAQQNLNVYTTLDLGLQKQAEQALRRNLGSQNDPAIQGAVLIADTSGRVVTMIGGTDYMKSQFNRAVQAYRQPGSAFKPFLYYTALEQGWRRGDRILDAEISLGSYQPKNFDGTYRGEVSLEDSFVHSLNTPAIRLIQAVGAGSVKKTAEKLGISAPLKSEAGLALGASEVPLSEMVTAYQHIANKGRHTALYGITSIESEGGEKLYDHKPSRQRYGERSHFSDLSNMMERVIMGGTGKNARLPGRYAAGKTGTSENYRDAWFIGFTDDYIGGIWLGKDDNSPMNGVTGGGLPAHLWADVMQKTDTLQPAGDQDGFFRSILRSLNN